LKKNIRSSGNNYSPTILWYDTDSIENDANSLLLREGLYWVVT
jgi:hypothetical protein